MRRLVPAWPGVGVFCAVALALACGSARAAEWPGWGGLHRDFKPESGRLAERWPENGPREIYRRPLGRGCSTILVDGDRLFTHFRDGEEEVVIALDRATGKTVWEFRDSVPESSLDRTRFVTGPNATPALDAGRLYAVGATGRLHALDQTTGKLLWSHDLRKEYGANQPGHGYSSSPLVHGGAVIVLVGGKGSSVMAFSGADGSVLWRSHDAANSYASPVLVRVAGREQLVAAMGVKDLLGLDPATGRLLWSQEFERVRDRYIGSPTPCGKGRLFVSTGSMTAATMLELSEREGKTVLSTLWTSAKARLGFTNPVVVGDTIYTTTSGGSETIFFLEAIDLATGKVLWAERTLPTNLLYADGKLIGLDVDGVLSLVTPSRDGYSRVSRAEVLEPRAWATPTLVGTRIYLRDEKSLVALEIGKGEEGPAVR